MFKKAPHDFDTYGSISMDEDPMNIERIIQVHTGDLLEAAPLYKSCRDLILRFSGAIPRLRGFDETHKIVLIRDNEKDPIYRFAKRYR